MTISFVVLFVHWSFILIFLVPRIGQLDFLKLHYTAEYGVDWIGGWYYVFTFPVLGLAVYLVNGWLAKRMIRTHRLFAEMVIQATVFLEIILAAAGVIAVLLNA